MLLRAWLEERAGAGADPLSVSNRGDRLSRDAVERVLRKRVALASDICPTLKGKRVTRHVLPQSGHEVTPERRGPHSDRCPARP
ncbi:MAG: hypothetical protein ACLQU2_00150 [Candidatus Binataceae bacterium]